MLLTVRGNPDRYVGKLPENRWGKEMTVGRGGERDSAKEAMGGSGEGKSVNAKRVVGEKGGEEGG